MSPPVKPFVKRRKNDAGGRRSGTDVVAVKTEERQWAACAQPGGGGRRFAVAEFGLVVPQGIANVRKLEDALPPARPGTPHCWSGSPKKKIDERKGACEGGLEAEHSRGRSLDRFGSLRAGRTGARLRGLADAGRGQRGRQSQARPRASVTEHRRNVGRSVGETTRDGLVAGACDQASEVGGGWPTARTAWALLTKKEFYQAAAAD